MADTIAAAVDAAGRQHTALPGEKRELAEVISSMPGIGALLGAEFLAATGGDLDAFGTADRLAGFAGLAPSPRDSGRVSGNLYRPRRYHRGLQRDFYTSALISIQRCTESRRFYDRKRGEGKRHTLAVLALARRRVNVLWALLRDRRCYQPVPPAVIAVRQRHWEVPSGLSSGCRPVPARDCVGGTTRQRRAGLPRIVKVDPSHRRQGYAAQ